MPSASPSRGDPDRPIDLAVVGHVNLDHLLEVRSLPGPDRTVPVESRRTELGGTAANLALTAARWGVRTALFSRIGDDFPAEFRDRLQRAGIDLRGLETVPRASSPACVIVHDAHGHQMTVIDQGPMADARTARVPLEVLRKCSWVHLSTGDPDFLGRIAEAAGRLGVRVSVDPAQEIHYRWSAALLRPYVARAEILFGNEHEVAAAARLLGRESPRQLIERVPLIVVTRGARGARAFFRGGTLDAPAPKVRGSGDPTGAGDAFRGGFYAGWFAGESLAHCLTSGSRAAATWLSERARRRHSTRSRP